MHVPFKTTTLLIESYNHIYTKPTYFIINKRFINFIKKYSFNAMSQARGK